ncbi:hypothetical protein Trydic_g11147 [Trypoxylus dichotomus]
MGEEVSHRVTNNWTMDFKRCRPSGAHRRHPFRFGRSDVDRGGLSHQCHKDNLVRTCLRSSRTEEAKKKEMTNTTKAKGTRYVLGVMLR